MAEKEISASIREMVAIMLKDVICLLAPFRSIFSQEFHEKLLGDFREAERQGLCRISKWSPSWSIITDTTSIVVFLAINYNACMPNTLKVFTN